MQCDAGIAIPQRAMHRLRRETKQLRIPGYEQGGRHVKDTRLLYVCGHRRHVGNGLSDRFQVPFPHAPLRLVIAAKEPGLYCGEKPHNLLFAGLGGAPNAMVGRTIEKSSLQQVLFAQH